jgi:predicted GIY-YIG superfamily endonuclease
MEYVVYGIADPTVHEVFYVGYTGNLKQRMWYFMEDGKGAVGERVHEIHTCGATPAAFELEKTATEALAKKAKSFWIKTLKERGAPLLNREAGPAKKQDAASKTKELDHRSEAPDQAEINKLAYTGDYAELEQKYGKTRDEMDQWIAQASADQDFDKVDGFDED